MAYYIVRDVMAHIKSSGKQIEVVLCKNSNKDLFTVILLGRVNLPFREHRDGSQYHQNVG